MSERQEQTNEIRTQGAEQAPQVSDALSSLVEALIHRGRDGIGRLASQGRVRIELRQLRRDRDEMFTKLGREARALLEGGEIDHPGLRRGVERIEALEAQIAEVEMVARVPQQAAEE